MKSVVYYTPGDIRVEDIPIPECRVGEFLVKVEACAVCGTDLKSFTSGNPRIKSPLTMGHEFTGTIEKFGDTTVDFIVDADGGTAINNGGFQLGDRVVMATSVSCGTCYYCQRKWPNLCTNLAPMGFSFAGGMAEYVVIPELAIRNGHVVKVPTSIPPIHACLAEPVSCAVNSVQQCQVTDGDTVLVLGAGPMGLLNALVARYAGASKVIMSEPNPLRFAQAKMFEPLLSRVVNPSNEDLAELVRQETDGIGCDVVIVAAPAAVPQEQSLQYVRKQGTVCLFASLPVGNSLILMDSRPLHYGEIRVIGSSDSTPEHVAQAVSILAEDGFPAAQLVTHTLPLDGIFEAFHLMKSGNSLRVVLVP